MHMSITEKLLGHTLSVATFILGLIPPAMGRLLGKYLGRIWFDLDKKHRKITLDSLAHAYEKEMTVYDRWLTARRVFENTATMLFEHTWFHRLGPGRYWKYFRISGIEHFWAAYAKGRGVLCFSGHLGNWELASVLCRFTGVPFSVVYKTIESPVSDNYIKSKRASSGCRMIPVHNAMDHILESLAKGEVAGLIIDQNSRKREHSVFVDFFGRKASANTGLAWIALRTKAPVLPVLTYRKNDRMHLDILPEISMVQTGDQDHDILVNTQACHSVIEDYIRQYPDQWLWLHNRWKTRPLEEV